MRHITLISATLAMALVSLVGSAAAGVYSSTVLSDGPASYWTFDESATGTGTAFDLVDGNDGTFTGTATRTTGLVGVGAAQFNHTGGDGVNVTNGVGHTNDFSFTSAITVEALILPGANLGSLAYEEIFRKEDGNNRILLSFQLNGSILSFGLNTGVYSELDMPLDGSMGRPTLADLKDGQVHHVAATYDSATGEKAIWIDGTNRYSQAFTPGTTITSGGGTAALIGNYASNNEPFDGVIDEMAVYGSALTAADVYHHAYVAGLRPGLRLSTDVLGPGHFSVGTWNNQDGYTSPDGAVELVGLFTQAAAGSVALTRQGASGPTANFTNFVSGDGTAGDWGSDTHGRGGNLWIPGDGETDTAHLGFGAHANKFITFDLADIRSEYLTGSNLPLVLSARVGVNGNVGTQNPPNAVIQGGVWLDGKLLNMSPELSRTSSSYQFNVILPTTGRYLTLAMLNGNSSTAYDDVAIRDALLRAVPNLATVAAESRGENHADYAFTTIDGPSSTDYADTNSGNGVTFKLVGGSAHGAGQQPDGSGFITVLNDGSFPTGTIPNPQTFLHGDGDGQFAKFLIDLNVPGGRPLDISQINVFGSNSTHRARDYMIFDLYGTNELVAPSTDGDLVANGWIPIATVNEIPDPKSLHTRLGVNITDIEGYYRNLLLVTYPDPNEATVFSSHYVEFDIFGLPVPEPATISLLGLGLVGLVGLMGRRRRRKG